MEMKKHHIGMVLAVISMAILASGFFLPLWVIEREERAPTETPVIYGNSSHEFKLLGISTTHRSVILGVSYDDRWETAYSDIEGSKLDTHFLTLTVMMATGIALTAILLILYHLSQVRKKLRLIALILGFAVIFVVLGSAAYLHLNVPSEVGNSRYAVGNALGYTPEAALPDIESFAGTDFNQTSERTLETTWGPSFSWYSAFVVCIIMVFAIMLLESRPKEEDANEDPQDS